MKTSVKGVVFLPLSYPVSFACQQPQMNVYGTQNDWKKKKKVEPRCLKEEAHLASPTPMDSQQVLPQFQPWCCPDAGNLQNRYGTNKEQPPCFDDRSCNLVTTTFHAFVRTFPTPLKKRKRWVLALDCFYYIHGLESPSIYMNCKSI